MRIAENSRRAARDALPGERFFHYPSIGTNLGMPMVTAAYFPEESFSQKYRYFSCCSGVNM